MERLIDLPLSGPDGSTEFVDLAGNSWSRAGTARIVDNALQLDGSGASIYASVMGSMVGPFRIAFEFQTTQTGRGFIVEQGWQGHSSSDPVRPWGITLEDGALVWQSYSPTETHILSGPVADGQWHDAAFERGEDSVLRLTLDGVEAGEVVLPGAFGPAKPFTLGTVFGFAGLDFVGRIRNFILEAPGPPGAGLLPQNVTGHVGAPKAKRLLQNKLAHVSPPVFPVETKVLPQNKITRGVPPWWGPPNATTQLPTYELRGRVLQRDPDTGEDVPCHNIRVALFFRKLHSLVDIQLSDRDGYVHFKNLMPGNQAYYAIAFDAAGAPVQNSILWDRLTSVPGTP